MSILKIMSLWVINFWAAFFYCIQNWFRKGCEIQKAIMTENIFEKHIFASKL
jgi:hypothetical protein